MTEALKTVIFVVAAVVTVTAAYLLNSVDNSVDVQQYVGQELTEEIDLDAPRSLEIVKFDRSTASIRKFEVAEVDGVWSIPSKDNYPADATQQMADAVTSLMDRRILRIAGETAESHAEYGVVDPLAPKLDTRSTGVGTRVTMTDADGVALIDLIIGKAVKDNPAQRYVRRVNQDVVYVVELDPSKLSTSFADWIEDDLLLLSVMDLRKVFINDYSADLKIARTAQGYEPRILLDPRSEITLVRADESADWRVATLKKGDRDAGKIIDDKLADDEEVNQESVQGLINGLEDLAIVDIARKPTGLSADLKAGEAFLNEEEAVSDLVEKGFIPGRQQSGSDMFSSEGEIVVSERNGVEYVLRFGQLQVQTESDGEGEDSEADAETTAADAAATPAGDEAAAVDTAAGDAAAEGENLRRYLFVMARFNEDAVEKPEYKDLPELPAEDGAAEEEAPAEEEAADEEAPAEGNAEGADAEDEEPADDSDADADREQIVAEREAIEAENADKREQYEQLISAGQEEVTKLNNRFGDWYFVISNDVYKQIHVGRDQVIKKREKPAEVGAEGAADGADAPGATSGLPDLGGAVAPAVEQ